MKEYFKIDIGKKENKTIEINKEVDKKNKKSDENEDETEKLREKFRIFEKNNVNIVNYKSWKEIEKLINNMD
ncbi:MAG: hypothetical protein LBC61_03055 [Candidatus Peribacteria bacterium]|nr:hypothetical protein [Candidatus Peribacteria bacterium]